MANNKIIDLSALQEFLAKCDIRYQATLVSGTNIKTINNTTLLGSGNYAFDSELSDSSTNAVQNKALKGYLDDISTRLATLEESIIADETLDYTYLQQSAIPTNSNTYPIIESAGMDNTDIKGHSFAYNQQYKITQDNTNTQDGLSCAMSIANNTFTFNGTTTAGSYCEGTYRFPVPQAMISGHKYLVFSKAISGSSTGQIRFRFTALGTQDIDQTTPYILTANSNSKRVDYYYNNGLTFTNYVVKLYCFDLTQSGIDSATTVDEAIALLRQNGISPYEYNEYSAGKINDSKPTALVSHFFNVFDETHYLIGELLNSGATNTYASSGYITLGTFANKIKILPNTTYFVGVNGANVEKYFAFYDKNGNNITARVYASNTSNITTPSNATYMLVSIACGDTSYQNNICINISNASLNGQYRPYKAPISYSLNLPDMRSALTIQDDVKKKYVGQVDLGTLNWQRVSIPEGFYVLQAEIDNLITARTYDLLCELYNVVSDTVTSWGQMTDKTIAKLAGTGTIIRIRDDSYTNSATFKSDMNGVYLNYPLATPTDQPSITIPENIEFEKGGSLEVTYDETAPTPADFDFEVAVYKPIQ